MGGVVASALGEVAAELGGKVQERVIRCVCVCARVCVCTVGDESHARPLAPPPRVDACAKWLGTCRSSRWTPTKRTGSEPRCWWRRGWW